MPNIDWILIYIQYRGRVWNIYNGDMMIIWIIIKSPKWEGPSIGGSYLPILITSKFLWSQGQALSSLSYRLVPKQIGGILMMDSLLLDPRLDWLPFPGHDCRCVSVDKSSVVKDNYEHKNQWACRLLTSFSSTCSWADLLLYSSRRRSLFRLALRSSFSRASTVAGWVCLFMFIVYC